MIIGASLTAVTVYINGSATDEVASLTVKTKLEIPFWLGAGFMVTVQFGAVPAKTIFASGSKAKLEEERLIEVVQFNTLSISLIVKLMTTELSSATVVSAIAEIVGGSSKAVTVNVNGLVTAIDPSLKVSITLLSPF